MRRTPARAVPLAAFATALLCLAVAGCSSLPPAAGAGPSAGAASSGTGTAGDGGAATAGLTTGSPRPGSGRPCTLAVGSQLRERTTAAATGAVTVLAGPLDCRAVGIWVSAFRLDRAAAADPTPRFAGLYTGAGQLTASLPAASGPCTAAAVYLAADADDARETSAAATAAEAVRADLASWPAGRAATVPTVTILRGRASAVLVATVSGDPSRCSPGRSVDTPAAVAGDCWLAAPSGSAGSSGGGSGFRRTECTDAHTHEVYWAEGLSPAVYTEQTRGRPQPAPAWARQRAVEVCQARRSTVRLAGGLRQSDVTLEVLWPSDLSSPPARPADWSGAQLACLARWSDGRSAVQRLLRP